MRKRNFRAHALYTLRAGGGVYTHNYTLWSGSRDQLESLKIIVGKGTMALFVPLLNVQPTPSFPTRHSFNPAFTG